MRAAGLVAVKTLLQKNGEVTPELNEVIRRGYLRVVDTRAIVEDSCSDGIVSRLAERGIQQRCRTQFGAMDAARELIRETSNEGLGTNLHSIMMCFGAVLLELAADASQRGAVFNWSMAGQQAGCFLMTDRGGPDLNSWRTQVYQSEQAQRATVDKVYALAPSNVGFALLTCKSSGLFPALYLVPPSAFSQLKRTPAGRPWLDDSVQVQNMEGDIELGPEWELSGTRAATIREFLSICRPNVVLAFLSHVEWLASRKRIRVPRNLERAKNSLRRIAEFAATKALVDRYFAAEAMAVKFAGNELILDLVLSDCDLSPDDSRDLLGFTKMEGSTYRCFSEIISLLGLTSKALT